MILKMITYDSEYGDAVTFDEHLLFKDSYEQLRAGVSDRFVELIRNRILLVEQSGDVVGARSGRTAETYLLAFPSINDAEAGVNGVELSSGIFFDVEGNEVSCGLDGYVFWDHLCDAEDGLIDTWELHDVLSDQPPELGGQQNKTSSVLQGWELTKFLFDLLKNRTQEN
jgi:hypothetical protein